MATTKTIRSVERAIIVLRALHQHSPVSLSHLSRVVELPKSSILRILLTLQQGGLVRRGIADELYRVTTGLNFLDDFDAEAERFAEMGASELIALRRNIGWPIDLNIRRGLYMIAIESSRGRSHFNLSADVTQLGERINIISSAVGRAYLANCPPDEYTEILQAALTSDDPLCHPARKTKTFEKQIEDVRQRGFGTRSPDYLGQTLHTGMKYDDGLASIAVAVRGKNIIYGTLVVLWYQSAATVAEMADKHLDQLRNSAAEIARSLDETSVRQA
ncbi:MAG: helix-turn-helix domain-containing protein [Rhodospirillaceae bacterium]|jgi:IclR family transcriptional regulator, mhp operon transcriptional activator|nr:helix-turn-helix domain-containing protein [Rhodospirillaceae bacterium]MBT7956382.1 helix-turn-helix domain-containing protein [Rhodospirillaceae bacterium]